MASYSKLMAKAGYPLSSPRPVSTWSKLPYHVKTPIYAEIFLPAIKGVEGDMTTIRTVNLRYRQAQEFVRDMHLYYEQLSPNKLPTFFKSLQ